MKKILVVTALLFAVQAMALDKDSVDIQEDGGVYSLRAAFDVPASVDQIKSVLTDFTHPSRLSSAVTARDVLGQQDSVVRVRTEIRGCVVFFCKTMLLLHDVTVTGDGVRADVVPDESDFRHGFLHWSIDGAAGAVSHVVFVAVMEPDFFVPPIIGDLLIRNALRKHVLETAENLVIEAPREPLSGDEQQ